LISFVKYAKKGLQTIIYSSLCSKSVLNTSILMKRERNYETMFGDVPT